MENESTVQHRRVLLAQDVIKHLMGRVFLASRSHVLYSDTLRELRDSGLPLQQAITEVKECRVCAKGAAFLAHIVRHNSVTVNQLSDLTGSAAATCGNLDFCDYFDARLQSEMEVLFEGQVYNWDARHLSNSQQEELKDQRATLPQDPNERLLVMMFRLIQNEGNYFTHGDTFFNPPV